MLVDSKVWTAFYYNAQRALAQAIQASLHSNPHVLSLDASKRDSSRASTRELVMELDTLTTQLNDVATDILNVSKEVQKYRLHSNASMSLIGILPPEVLRDIVRLAVESSKNTRRILRLSHVSSVWRTGVNGTSDLVTEIQCGSFHIDFVKVWQTRAKERSQMIDLCDSDVTSVFWVRDEECDYMEELRYELNAALENCAHLKIHVQDSSNLGCVEEWLGGSEARQMRRMSLSVFHPNPSVPISIEPEFASSFRVLHLDGVRPQLSVPFLSITEMYCKLPTDDSWSEWAIVLSQLPHLERLSLRYPVGYRVDTALATSLPSLHTFSLQVISWDEKMIRMVRTLAFPNVKHLTLDDASSKEGETIWNIFVSLFFRFGFQYAHIA